MDYVCQLHLDSREAPNLVCMRPSCINAGVLCRFCEKDNHEGHQVISIGKLQERIFRVRSENASAVEIERLLHKTMQLEKYTHEGLLAFKSSVVQRLERLEQQIKEFYQRVKWQFESQAKLLQDKVPPGFELDFAESLRTLDDKVKKIVEWLVEFEQQEQRSRQVSERIYQKACSFTSEVADQIRQAEQVCCPQITSIGYRRPEPKTVSQIVWQTELSNEFRHQDLIGCSMRVIRAENTVGNKRVCVMGNTILGIKPATVYRCCVNLKEISRWIYLGIAVQQKVEANSFTEHPWYQTGKGHYIMSENGIVFSHSDGSLNGKKRGFSFGKGNQIVMQLNTDKMELTFSSGNESYKMSVVALEGFERYRFVIYLDQQSDTIELEGP